MAAIFGPRANLVTNATLLALAALALFAAFLIWGVPQMHYNTQASLTALQPVPFSHQHHVSGLGIDCRYCHSSVEYAPSAGMPPTETCMTCHSQIWTHAAVLEPVRQSFAIGKPLRWTRVYRLPAYVFFNHSIHIAKGVGCNECHGQVEEMPLTRQAKHMYMLFCLNCHTDPAPRLRPRDQVFNMKWQRTSETPPAQALLAAYNIHPEILSDCSICHR
jgi:hypothetical protein